jgi:hypothetical protein
MLDPETGSVEQLRSVRLEEAKGIVDVSEIAVGEDAMWPTTQSALYRLDPFNARVIGVIEITRSTGLAWPTAPCGSSTASPARQPRSTSPGTLRA